jgi:hypothetical protein
MKHNSLPLFAGASLALIAAGLAGCATAAPSGHGATASADKVELVHCSSVNSCKGHNDCKTASNACKGMGSCKGQGFVLAPAGACSAIGGKVIDAGMTTSVAASEMVHCNAVNSCKGHNDCKTASNACKGHGSCKGQGFVAMPAAACANVGGSAG